VICLHFVSLTYWFIAQQQQQTTKVGCDLLTFCIFDILIYSFYSKIIKKAVVVICLHFVSLTYWFIAYTRDNFIELRCDLLTFCIFDILIYSDANNHAMDAIVVICLHFVSLTYWFIANRNELWQLFTLWFAYILYLWHIDL